MSVITPESQAFIDKWAVLFADNEFENITEATFRAFTADVATLHEQGQYRALLLTASANSAESLLAGKTVQPGRLYVITGTPDPADPAGLSGTWNASGKEQTLYVVGLAPGLFASLGCLLDAATGTTRPVQVDVRAGTHQALAAGAPAGPAASAQLLGLDPATGELLVLLSPGAPTSLASYVLAEYAAGTTPPPPSTGGYVASGYVAAGYVS